MSNFENAAIFRTAFVSAIFGAYFGIIIDSRYLGGSPDNINNTGWKKNILCVLVSCLIGFIFLAPFSLISKEKDIVISYIFKSAVPMFCLWIFAFSYLKKILEALTLVNTK